MSTHADGHLLHVNASVVETFQVEVLRLATRGMRHESWACKSGRDRIGVCHVWWAVRLDADDLDTSEIWGAYTESLVV